MSIQSLLDQVPFLSKAGIQCESYSPGRVVLSLPLSDSNKNHVGTMHAAALFTVAEAAGGAACATHPKLRKLRLLARGISIQFRQAANSGVTAHAAITDEMAVAVEVAVEDGGKADLEVPVKVMDGHGAEVAHLTALFHFRRA